MSGADVLAGGAESAPSAPGGRGARSTGGARPIQSLRRLSHRTSLRTKLITAVLVLVAIAVAAISIATTYMVRAYLVGQHDSELAAQVNMVNITTHLPQGVDVGYASPTHSDIVVGLEQPGSQLQWEPGAALPFMNNNDPLPRLPTSSNWLFWVQAASWLSSAQVVTVQFGNWVLNQAFKAVCSPDE